MISSLAFKLALVYLLPYIYLGIKKHEKHGDNVCLTTSYISIDDVTSVTNIELELENMLFRTKYVRNATHNFVLVDLPPMIGLCMMMSMHAPTLTCGDRDTITMSELIEKLDTRLVKGAFDLRNFDYRHKETYTDLIKTGTYNYPFMVQSFPSLAVKLSAPVMLVSGNDCGAINCSIPRVQDFFIDGVRDTAVYVASHLAVKHIYNPYISSHVNRLLSPPLRYLSGPFRRWYNGALYAADNLNARAFESGLSASPQNIRMSTIAHEIAEGLPTYEFTGPLIENSVSVQLPSSIGSIDSINSMSLFKSPVSSGASSLSSGAATGIIASSRDAPVLGAVSTSRGLRVKYFSAPTLPNLGIGTNAMNAMSHTAIDALTQVPVRTVLAGQPSTINIIRSNSRNILAALSKTIKRIPKGRKRRQANVISRKIATSIRAVGKLAQKIPSWAVHTSLITVPWVFAGMQHLTTMDQNITVIHPIQRLASYERYFIAMSTLLFCQCFHNDEIRNEVNARTDANDTVRLNGKVYSAADIVFDIRLGIPGETLRLCSPFFAKQFVGMGQEVLLETLSVHFDTSRMLGDVLLYNGPAKYIVNDYVAYFNDVFPQFSPYIRYENQDNPDGPLVKVAEYNNNFSRSRRSSPLPQRVKRHSYTYTSRDYTGANRGAPRIFFDSGSAFTMSVQYLLDTPKLRYEFDILQATHYNTSFSYYKSLRHFTATSSIDFNDARSHSSFKAVGNITLLEILRGMNPFDLYIPRLNIIRELINGYDMNGDIRRLRRKSVKVNVQLEYADIPSILGLFYLIEYPTDLDGCRRIMKKDVPNDVMQHIGAVLYRTKFARVPLLIVASNTPILNSLKSMFIVHVRVMEDIGTWALYSPIMLTTALSMIPSGAYTICLSKAKSHTSAYSLFGEANTDLGADSLFADACDLASLHVTFDKHVSEILENQNMPDRLKSLLSKEPGSVYSMPSGGLYDPIISEVIGMVEPGHRAELEDNLRGAHDEGDTASRGRGVSQTGEKQRAGMGTIDPNTHLPAPQKSATKDTMLTLHHAPSDETSASASLAHTEAPKIETYLIRTPMEYIDTSGENEYVESNLQQERENTRDITQIMSDHIAEFAVMGVLIVFLGLVVSLTVKEINKLRTMRDRHIIGETLPMVESCDLRQVAFHDVTTE